MVAGSRKTTTLRRRELECCKRISADSSTTGNGPLAISASVRTGPERPSLCPVAVSPGTRPRRFFLALRFPPMRLTTFDRARRSGASADSARHGVSLSLTDRWHGHASPALPRAARGMRRPGSDSCPRPEANIRPLPMPCSLPRRRSAPASAAISGTPFAPSTPRSWPIRRAHGSRRCSPGSARVSAEPRVWPVYRVSESCPRLCVNSRTVHAGIASGALIR